MSLEVERDVAAQVCRDHLRVLLHLGGRAFGDLLAVVEHQHAIAHRHHELHVVLDQQDRRAVAPDRVEQALERRGFGGVHAGRGLVEREELRIGGERAGDLEPALVAVGQVPREVVGALGDADVLQQLEGALFDRPLLATRAGVAQHRAEHAGAGAHVAADHHVLERGEVAEQADVLERPGDAARGDVVRLQAAERLPGERERAAVGRVDAGQHVEERRLAGAVGADQSVDLARADLEADVGKRLDAAEALGDAACDEECTALVPLAGQCAPRGSAHGRPSSSRLRVAEGSRPAGRNSIMSTSAKPNSSMRITSGSTSILPNSARCAGSTV